jgi:hypothetical protein
VGDIEEFLLTTLAIVREVDPAVPCQGQIVVTKAFIDIHNISRAASTTTTHEWLEDRVRREKATRDRRS